MKKYYWWFAGLVVGVFTVLMTYVNLTLIIADDVTKEFNPTGVVAVIAEYVLLVYLLSRGQKLFNKKKK